VIFRIYLHPFLLVVRIL